MYCIHRVVWYRWSNELHLGWTCSQTGCPCTDGGFCDRFTLTVSTVGTMPGGLLNGSNCKYGDTVMLEKTTGDEFGIYEMTFTGYLAGQCVAHSLLESQIFIDITSLEAYLHFKWPHLTSLIKLSCKVHFNRVLHWTGFRMVGTNYRDRVSSRCKY